MKQAWRVNGGILGGLWEDKNKPLLQEGCRKVCTVASLFTIEWFQPPELSGQYMAQILNPLKTASWFWYKHAFHLTCQEFWGSLLIKRHSSFVIQRLLRTFYTCFVKCLSLGKLQPKHLVHFEFYFNSFCITLQHAAK